MAGQRPSFLEAELRTTDTKRHWSPSSQHYAPADVLLGFLADGWELSPVIGLEEHWHAGVRRVDVYHFELTKGDRTMVVPVHSNPIIRRLIEERGLKIVMLPRETAAVGAEAARAD